MQNVFMGIDSGSVSTNIVLIDSENSKRVLKTLYLRTNGQPLKCLADGFRQIIEEGYTKDHICGVGVTGSARELIGHIIRADIIKNEITSHALAAIHYYPDTRTILEIGGQDSKIIIIRDGIVVDFAMNTICAAGTGSFLDQQAFRLNIPIEDFGSYAVRANKVARIAGRCTVFAESDMVHKQQQGASKEELIAGLCEALVRNYLNNIAKGKSIHSSILFQGGVANNIGIVKEFEKQLEKKITIPEHFSVMGALGSSLLAAERIKKSNKKTHFLGFNIAKGDINIKTRICNDCTNQCELSQIYIDGSVVSVSGSRCGKW